MDENNITVAKIKIGIGDDENHHIIVKWDIDLQVTLVQNDHYWRGYFPPDRQENLYTDLCMSKEQYENNVKTALSTDDSSKNFIYELKDDQFIWKKVVDPKKNIKKRHGIIDMTYVSANGGNKLLVETLMTINKETKYRLSHKDAESLELARQLRDMLDKFNEFSKLKNEMEEDLYVKFITLLNAKKQRNAAMEEFLNEHGAGKRFLKTKQNICGQKLRKISDSDDSN